MKICISLYIFEQYEHLHTIQNKPFFLSVSVLISGLWQCKQSTRPKGVFICNEIQPVTDIQPVIV